MAKLTFKIWILIIVLILSLISIFGLPPSFLEKGILITGVEQNSSAFEQGLRQGQIITAIDGKSVESIDDFSKIIQEKYPSEEGSPESSLGGKEIKTIIQTKDSQIIFFSKQAPEITFSNIPKTKLKAGLDISGGARAVVQAQDKKLSKEEVNDLVAITNNRFNVYGISDIKVNPVSDLAGNNFMLIEIAGATPKDLKQLIEQQGKFEAKIGNETVFIGGERDVASVCRNDATCAAITACNDFNGGSICNFQFSIYLSNLAAEKHADVTKKLGINESAPEYLSKPLDLYVDDKLVDTLLISKDLQGRVTTQISISGSGIGETEEEAYSIAKENMNKLQTILITGSLPYKLEIVKLDTISPILGKQFIKIILLAGLGALLAVAIVIFVRYRKFKESIALLLTSFSEIIIILGIASMIDWNLDLLSIAGILAVVGTGIDQQIIILDESKQRVSLSVKEKLKRAFTIILSAYFTALVSLLPLLWAGAGLLKGFAITTIIGITIGILITRPAFTDIVKNIEE
ncbi:MAG: preprotein translocase subunit SecD [archaeon GW2011_AR19]|nr:MAG: preprotein translocase subunit SecD [archaeon GW2011_AR19]